MRSIFCTTVFAALFIFLSYSCQKIEFENPENLNISYSLDTLTFDTVFTQVGSTTQYFKIYNNGSKFARIQEISLTGSPSVFRLNVDGLSGNQFTDVEIPPRDSIYVFVEVTVDPDQPLSVSPFIIQDEISINMGSKSDQITLTAWGQNANYLPSFTAQKKQTLITCDLSDWVWDDPKPYVIYGVLVIDSCNVIIPAGTEIYIHGGIVQNGGNSYQDGVLFISKHGSLQINGEKDAPVTIQSDRLEPNYQTFINQWGRIQLGPESKNNKISYARILHAGIGILVDSLAQLDIDHSIIGFNGQASLASYRGIVNAENCLFHTAAGNNLSVTLGGFYRFKNCTFANSGIGQEAVLLRNYHCYNSDCSEARAAALNFEMDNCILYTSQSDALALQNGVDDPNFFKVKFRNNLIRAKNLLTDNNEEYANFFIDQPSNIQYINKDPLFLNVNQYNFTLDSISVAKNKGGTLLGITDDLIGNLRDDTPDIGAYEYID